MAAPFLYLGVAVGVHLVLRKRQRRKRRMQEAAADQQVSSLRVPGRHVAVVATASVPWMTGTAVNPTLRAAYLAHHTDLQVALLVPWIANKQQPELFKDHVSFDTPQQQEEHIRQWCRDRTGFEPTFQIRWYPAVYNTNMLGIFPVGDATQCIPKEEADVAVLEEPEHLTWHHHGARWTDRFNHVVGVMHTNYEELSRRTVGGVGGHLVGAISHVMNSALCSIHTHKIIKLSDAVQKLPRQVTEYVHGAAGCFLEIGDTAAHASADGGTRFDRGAYTLGKIVWGKGWEELLDMLEAQHKRGERMPDIDAYGSGEAQDAIKARSKANGLHLHFKGRIDHLDESLRGYKCFINSSTSDVVATTSVEALAMGKWVIAAQHPCNEFIAPFRNCLIYTTPEEFSANLKKALAEDPARLSEEERYQLSWEAATERFLDAAEIPLSQLPGPLTSLRDMSTYALYNGYMRLEALRRLGGAAPNTCHAPDDIVDVDPEARALRETKRVKGQREGWYRNARGSVSHGGGLDAMETAASMERQLSSQLQAASSGKLDPTVSGQLRLSLDKTPSALLQTA